MTASREKRARSVRPRLADYLVDPDEAVIGRHAKGKLHVTKEQTQRGRRASGRGRWQNSPMSSSSSVHQRTSSPFSQTSRTFRDGTTRSPRRGRPPSVLLG